MWKQFLGNGQSQPLVTMPVAPAWRQFMADEDFEKVSEESDRRWDAVQDLADKDLRGKERGESFRLEDVDTDAYRDVLNAVNAALHLRRPLLITGKPGSGKTSLTYAVAHELKLGAVLSCPINARSTLNDLLYRYDAIARLQDCPASKRAIDGRLSAIGTCGNGVFTVKVAACSAD